MNNSRRELPQDDRWKSTEGDILSFEYLSEYEETSFFGGLHYVLSFVR